MLLCVVGACLWLNTGIIFTLFCCLLSLLSVAYSSYFGIYMDSVNPKLIWDDELNALRGNYNIFFNMAMAIVTEGAICAGAYLLYKYTGIGTLLIIIMVFVLLMILCTVSYMLCHYRATRNIENIAG